MSTEGSVGELNSPGPSVVDWSDCFHASRFEFPLGVVACGEADCSLGSACVPESCVSGCDVDVCCERDYESLWSDCECCVVVAVCVSDVGRSDCGLSISSCGDEICHHESCPLTGPCCEASVVVECGKSDLVPASVSTCLESVRNAYVWLSVDVCGST